MPSSRLKAVVDRTLSKDIMPAEYWGIGGSVLRKEPSRQEVPDHKTLKKAEHREMNNGLFGWGLAHKSA
jgi:hypothetical protein